MGPRHFFSSLKRRCPSSTICSSTLFENDRVVPTNSSCGCLAPVNSRKLCPGSRFPNHPWHSPMDPKRTNLDSGVFNSATNRYYNAGVARNFFESGGQVEEFATGSKVFSEGDTVDKRGLFSKPKPHRMFLLS